MPGSIEDTIKASRKAILEASAKGKLTLLTGAGLSYNAGLPLGSELTVALLESVGFTPNESALLMKRSVRPEIIIEALQAAIGDATVSIFSTFSRPHTTKRHEQLALLEPQILTTNFDNLHELAAIATGYSHISTSDNVILYRSRHARFRHIIKLHGSCENPVALLSLLYQGLPKVITSCAQNVIDGSTLVILGYSCQDVDIFELVSGSTPSHIIWVDRSFNDAAHSFRHSIRSTHKVSLVCCDLSLFCNAVAGGEAETQSKRRDCIPWKSEMLSVLKRVPNRHKTSARARIASYMGLKALAVVQFERIKNEIVNNREMSKDQARSVGYDLLELARLQKAVSVDCVKIRSVLAKALKHFRHIDDVPGQSEALFELGMLSAELEDASEAQRAFASLRRLSTRQNVPIYEALADVGHAMLLFWRSKSAADCDKAKKLLENAEPRIKAAGRYRVMLLVRRRIASILFAAGDYERALNEDAKALMVARDIRDTFQESECIRDIATCERNLGWRKRAFQGYIAAYECGRYCPSNRNVGIILGNLSEMMLEEGFYRAAKEGANEAVSLLRAVGDRVYLLYFLQTVGYAMSRCGDTNNGMHAIDESITICKSMGDNFEEANSHHTKGMMLHAVGRISEARAELVKAYRKAVVAGHTFIKGSSAAELAFMEDTLQRARVVEAWDDFKRISQKREMRRLWWRTLLYGIRHPIRGRWAILWAALHVEVDVTRNETSDILFKCWLFLSGRRRYSALLASVAHATKGQA